MKTPPKMDKLSAKYTTTPFCYYSPTAMFGPAWVYFRVLGHAKLRAECEEAQVFKINRKTAIWEKV